mmetsp:Transcript_86409/g.137175  ORF Transcript_86409/g.137175 Transcript_86409/m.137175 type:complete len:228 (+) Transcript_86409:271-954(+)
MVVVVLAGQAAQALLEFGYSVLHNAAVVDVIGVALQADHIGCHATIGIGAALEDKGLHAAGVGDFSCGPQRQSLQCGAWRRKAELHGQRVRIVHHHADEGLESCCRLRIGLSLILLHVHVAHQDDRPSAVARHVVQVHARPISRDVSGEDIAVGCSSASFCHATECNGFLGCPGLSCKVCEGHFGQSEVVTVAGIQVADAVLVVLQGTLHAWRSLHSLEGALGWPAD